MAKVKFGGGITEMRGKMGGNVFSRNGSCAYVKKLTIPTNPQTIKQLAVRGIFSNISAAWDATNVIARLRWNLEAALIPFTNSVGDVFYLSGKGLFQKCCGNLVNVGESILTDCPDEFTVPDTPSEFSFLPVVSGPAFSFTSGDAVVPADRIYIVDSTIQVSPGLTNANSLFKRIAYVDEAAPFDAVDFIASYQAVFGGFTVGQQIQCRIASINKLNGMMSPYIKATAIVVDST